MTVLIILREMLSLYLLLFFHRSPSPVNLRSSLVFDVSLIPQATLANPA
jgi:hypothetical protein